MYRNFLLFALAITVVFLTSNCSGQSTSDTTVLQPVTSTVGNEVEFSDLGLNFPPPSEMAARVTSINEDWLKPGCNYEEELPFANVAIEDASLLYRVVSESEPGTYQTSHAFYAFNIINHPMFTELKLIWHDYPGHLPCWVGLPIIETDEWDWIPLPANCRLYLNDISQYMSEEAPLTVGVVLAGRENQLLDFIRLGKNTEPSAHLSATPDTGAPPLEVTLDASESTDSDGNIVRYDWDFDGDGITDSRSYTQSWCKFTYRFPGSYNATVKVFDDSGDFGSASTTVLISDGSNLLPEAVLTADPLSGDPPLTVEFDASDSTDHDGEIVRYDWDFDGDGAVDHRSSTSSAIHEYKSEGIFYARVWVTDNAGAQDSDSVTINSGSIINQPPVAQLNADPISGSAPCLVTFDGSASTDADGSIVLFEFDFDGNGVYDCTSATDPVMEYEYLTDGTYQAKLRVTDNEGATSTASIEISLYGWTHTWGGWYGDYMNDVTEDGNGNTYACGFCNLHGQMISPTEQVPLMDAVICRITEQGDFQWIKAWDECECDTFKSLAVDSDRNIWVCGFCGEGKTTYPSHVGGELLLTNTAQTDGCFDIMLLKISPSGGLLMSQSWGGNGADYSEQILIDDQDNKYIIGFSSSFNDDGDLLVMKYGASGNLLWSKTYGINGYHEIAHSALFDQDGQLTISGNISLNDRGFIIKIGTDGTVNWGRIYEGANLTIGRRILIDSNNDIYFTGACINGEYDYDGFLLKLDSLGNQIWSKRFGSTELDYGFSCAFGDENNILIGGGLKPYDDYRNTLYSFTPDGEITSARMLDGRKVRLTLQYKPDMNLYMTGSAENQDLGNWIPIDTADIECEDYLVEISDLDLQARICHGSVGVPSGELFIPEGKIDEIVDRGDCLIMKHN